MKYNTIRVCVSKCVIADVFFGFTSIAFSRAHTLAFSKYLAAHQKYHQNTNSIEIEISKYRNIVMMRACESESENENVFCVRIQWFLHQLVVFFFFDFRLSFFASCLFLTPANRLKWSALCSYGYVTINSYIEAHRAYRTNANVPHKYVMHYILFCVK